MNEDLLDAVIITIDDQHLESIQTVADALMLAGMKVSGVLPTVGIISGSVARAAIGTLKTVRGVAAVELDQEMRAIRSHRQQRCPGSWWWSQPIVSDTAPARLTHFNHPARFSGELPRLLVVGVAINRRRRHIDAFLHRRAGADLFEPAS